MTLTFNKIKTIRLAIFLSMFFGFFLSFNNGNVFADSNPTYTLSLDPSSDIVLCDNDSPGTSVMNSACSDYTYLTIDTTGFSSASDRNQFLRYSVTSTSVWASTENYYPFFHNKQIITLNNAVKVTVFASSDFSSGSFTFTLSTQPVGCTGIVPEGDLDITSNGTYDVTSLSSVTVDIDQTIDDPISKDFQEVFFEIVKNIIPAFGILLVVWFGIDMLSSLIFGRGR